MEIYGWSYGKDEGADEMNLSKQIKRLREEAGFSQEELSEKIYVSRQTISNWENERSYPDIHNLLLLSVLFDVTLDELVKGDVETMKNVIKKDEMNRYSYIMLGTIGAMVISIGPTIKFFGMTGLIIPLLFWVVCMWAALKIEKIKKEKNIKTYQEIVAYMEGENVDEKRQERNLLNHIFLKAFIVIAFTVVFFLLLLLSVWVTGVL